MGAGHGDAVFEPHQFGQHFGPRDHRDRCFHGSPDFRVVRPDGRRGHHHVHVMDVVCRMSLVDGSPELFQAVGHIRKRLIRTGHPVAQVDQQFGDAAHADAADADKKDMILFSIHSLMLYSV